MTKDITAFCRDNWFWIALVLILVAGYHVGKDYALKQNKEGTTNATPQ